MHPRLREKHYRTAISNDFHNYSGTAYACNDQDIQDTSLFSDNGTSHPPVTPVQMNLDLIQHNDPKRPTPSHELAALKRLAYAFACAKSGFWAPDLIIKCFFDLDTVFFGGTLRGNVRIRWDTTWQEIIMGQMSYGLAPRNCLAITGRRDGGRADIGLNARNIFLVPREGESPLETMFTATLHEMNHAYAYVRLGSTDSEPGHGFDFVERLRGIYRRAKDGFGLEARDVTLIGISE